MMRLMETVWALQRGKWRTVVGSRWRWSWIPAVAAIVSVIGVAIVLVVVLKDARMRRLTKSSFHDESEI